METVTDVPNHENVGQNHPIRLGQQFKPLMPPPSSPTSNSVKKAIISRDTWPKGASGSKNRARPSSAFDGRAMITRPTVGPKFVSNPDSVLPGYQEVHLIYDEMRQFFAKKAMSVHNGEVVVIKVTMMSLKPGYRSPSVVSVRVTNLE